MSGIRRFVKILRSRKVAIGLLVVIALWSAVGASSPAWFGSPVFLLLSLWLFTSTTVCAWERTRRAIDELKPSGGVTSALTARLETAQVLASSTCGVDEARGLAVSAMRGAGLRTRSTARVVEGSSGVLGIVGSPLFHWSLALLFVLVAYGQLVRSDGLMGVPVGGSVPNDPAEYGVFAAGRLHGGRHSDLVVSVSEMRAKNVVDGIDRGPTPRVSLSRGGQVVAQGDVYPNSPLRYGSMLVHYSNRGYVAVLEIRDGSDSVIDVERAYFDYDKTAQFGLAGGSISAAPLGISELVSVAPAKRASKNSPPRVRVQAGDGAQPVELDKGSSMPLGTGSVRLASVSEYARLSIVDDPSVYPMYVVFALATLGLAFAIIWPPRKMWILVQQTDEGVTLRAVVRQPSRNPTLVPSVRDRLEALLEGGTE